MATRLYMRSTARSLSTIQCDSSQALDFTPGTSLATLSGNTAGGADGCTSALFFAVPGRVQFVSPPLEAVTISGAITINVWMSESSMSANCQAMIGIWQVSNTGVAINGILGCRCGASGIFGSGETEGSELGTSRAAENWVGTPVSRTLSAGDRIAVAVGYDNVGTMGSGFSCSFGYDDDVAAADGDSWVEFTETITEQVAAVPRHGFVNYQDPGVL